MFGDGERLSLDDPGLLNNRFHNDIFTPLSMIARGARWHPESTLGFSSGQLLAGFRCWYFSRNAMMMS